MRRLLVPVLAVTIAIAFVATFASAQPGIGIVKTPPLSGTGSNGSPMKIDLCANGQILKSNGTAWTCSADTSGVTQVSTVAPLTGGPITTVGSVSIAPCASNEILKWNGSAWACAADGGGFVKVAPAATTGTVDNWAVGQTRDSFVYATTSGTTQITGITGGVDGQQIRLLNAGAHTVSVFHEFASSTAANRIRLSGGVSSVTMDGGAECFIDLAYNGATSRWHQVGYYCRNFSTGTVTTTGVGVFGGAVSDTGNRVFSVAGNGLTSTGATVDAVCATNSLQCNANSIQIPDRDFGSISVSSTGTVMTIDASSVSSSMLNITPTSCTNNSDLTAISATGTGTCRSLDLAGTSSSTGTLNITRSFDEPVIEFTGAGVVTVAGIGPPSFGGIQTIRLINNTGNKLTLAHESGSATAAAWRIVTSQAVNSVIDVEGIALLVYSATDSRWHFTSGGSDTQFSTSGGQGGLVPGSNGASTSCLKGDATWGSCGGAVSQTISTSSTETALAVNSTTTDLTLNLGANILLQGIANGAAGRKFKMTVNQGFFLTIQIENAGASAANRIMIGDGAEWGYRGPVVLDFVYDTTNSRWTFSAAPSIRMPSLTTTPGGITAATSVVAGTYLASGTDGVYAGTNSDVYIDVQSSIGSINGEYGTAGLAEFWLNRLSNSGGTSNFRDLKIGNGKNTAFVTFSGTNSAVTVTNAVGGANSLSATNSATTQTTGNAAVRGDQTGSYNTTSGALASYAVRGSSTSTRSSGANNLTNYGVYGNASGAQVNYGVFSDGDLGTTNGNMVDVGTLPTLSSCGTNSRTGGEWSWNITPGSVTACTITFAKACAAAPTCQATPYFSTTAIHYFTSVGTSSAILNVTGTGWSGSQVVGVTCICH